jgi:hypothetical protein
MTLEEEKGEQQIKQVVPYQTEAALWIKLQRDKLGGGT